MITFTNEGSERAFAFALDVSAFRHTVRARAKILAPLFEDMVAVGDRFRTRRAVRRAWTHNQWLDEFMDPSSKVRFAEHEADRATYEDAGAVLVLLLVPEMERFYKKTGESLYVRGQESYVSGIAFSSALRALSNQYKHLGAWLKEPGKVHNGKAEVEKLVDNAFRSDAASEFFLRCGFADYEALQSAVLSCSDGLIHPPLVVADEGALPSVKLQYPKP